MLPRKVKGSKSALELLGTGTSFAFVVLSRGCTKFAYDINLGQGITAVSHLPIRLDRWWVKQLGTVVSEVVADSECVLAATTHKLGDVRTHQARLAKEVLLAYRAVALACGPTGVQAYLIAGADDSGRLSVYQEQELPIYDQVAEPLPRDWTPWLIRSSAPVLAALVQAENGGEASRRLRRGINVLLEALSSSELPNRLHGYVRALEALLDIPKKLTGAPEFAKRLQDFCSCRWSEAKGTFEDLYALRNKIEHMCNPEETDLRFQVGDFKTYIESETRLAERAALGVYRRVLGEAPLFQVFADTNQLRNLWTLSPNDRRSVWGKSIQVDGRAR